MTLLGFGEGAQLYGLILSRIMGLVFTAPVFSSETVPVRIRMILAMGIAAMLYPVTYKLLPPLPESVIAYGLSVLSQISVGVVIGFMVSIVFAAFQMAGDFFSAQAGLSFSEVLDPQSQISTPIIGSLKNLIGVLLFISVDFRMDGVSLPASMHMLRALSYSFVRVPELVFDMKTLSGLLMYADQAFGVMFITALKIGIPVVGILFVTSVALGLLGRAAPQMNLMNMGLPINIIVGLLLLFTIMPVIVPLMQESFYNIFDRIGEMFRTWPVRR